jgi:histidyl-tRNA synthetase
MGNMERKVTVWFLKFWILFLAKANTVHLENKDSTKLTSSISEKALRYDLTVPFAATCVQHQNDIEFF